MKWTPGSSDEDLMELACDIDGGVEQELQSRGPYIRAGAQGVFENEDRNDLFGLPAGLSERSVIVKPQVAAEPVDDPFHEAGVEINFAGAAGDGAIRPRQRCRPFPRGSPFRGSCPCVRVFRSS